VVAVALGFSSPRAQEDTLLDLAASEVRAKIESARGGCGGWRLATGTQGPVSPPELALTLEIESLKPENAKVNDQIVYQVRFTSRGEKAIWFPWSPDWDTAYSKNCQWPAVSGARALRSWLNLEFTDEAGYVQSVAAQELFGISTKRGTYRVIAPSASVRIQAAGRIGLERMVEERRKASLAFKLPQEFAVRAVFNLDDSALPNPYKTLRSTNQLRVKVAAE